MWFLSFPPAFSNDLHSSHKPRLCRWFCSQRQTPERHWLDSTWGLLRQQPEMASHITHLLPRGRAGPGWSQAAAAAQRQRPNAGQRRVLKHGRPHKDRSCAPRPSARQNQRTLPGEAPQIHGQHHHTQGRERPQLVLVHEEGRASRLGPVFTAPRFSFQPSGQTGAFKRENTDFSSAWNKQKRSSTPFPDVTAHPPFPFALLRWTRQIGEGEILPVNRIKYWHKQIVPCSFSVSVTPTCRGGSS